MSPVQKLRLGRIELVNMRTNVHLIGGTADAIKDAFPDLTDDVDDSKQAIDQIHQSLLETHTYLEAIAAGRPVFLNLIEGAKAVSKEDIEMQEALNQQYIGLMAELRIYLNTIDAVSDRLKEVAKKRKEAESE